jgi:uncharacterized protein (DUF302 family)
MDDDDVIAPPRIEGLTSVRSHSGFAETIRRLEAGIRARGLTLLARIDHSALAAEAGLSLRPTELFLFGNPRAGTPLMQANQTIGIDLPLKALVWEDGAGVVWISYNEPEWLVLRHLVSERAEIVGAMSMLSSTLAGEATTHSLEA